MATPASKMTTVTFKLESWNVFGTADNGCGHTIANCIPLFPFEATGFQGCCM